jgi:hypothetical protein
MRLESTQPPPLFLGAFVKSRNPAIIVVMSVRLSAWNNSAPTRQTFMKYDICVLFENMSRRFRHN